MAAPPTRSSENTATTATLSLFFISLLRYRLHRCRRGRSDGLLGTWYVRRLYLGFEDGAAAEGLGRRAVVL